MTIIQAKLEHLEDLAPLFDRYRIFYRQDSNIDEAKDFLKARITNKESIIFIAYCDKNL